MDGNLRQIAEKEWNDKCLKWGIPYILACIIGITIAFFTNLWLYIAIGIPMTISVLTILYKREEYIEKYIEQNSVGGGR